MNKKTDNAQRERFINLLRDDQRYSWEAYLFVREALRYAQEVLELGSEPDEETVSAAEFEPRRRARGERPERHLTGQQLCHAIRCYAQDQYGYLAQIVLGNWGLRTTGDIGEIVYNLISIEEMKKSPTDRREDFDDVFDFGEVFRRDFQITRVE